LTDLFARKLIIRHVDGWGASLKRETYSKLS